MSAGANGQGSQRALEAISTRAMTVTPPALRYYTLAEALDDPELMAPPCPVVAPLAYAGRVTVLSAREKMGKSTLTGQVVATLTAGVPFLEEVAAPVVPVLWYAVDEPLGDAVRRLKDHGAPPSGGIQLCGERPDAAEVARMVGETGARLVVVDTLSELWRGRVEKDSDAGQVAGFIRPYVDVARATGAALLFLYHTNKAGAEYRGSVALGATVDGVLTLKSVHAGTIGAGAAPIAGRAPADDDDTGDDGQRLLVGRTRWGLIRVRLTFDGERYARGDEPLSPRIRALRAIAEGVAKSGTALARSLGIQKLRALQLVKELTREGLVRSPHSGALALTPDGERAVGGRWAPLGPAPGSAVLDAGLEGTGTRTGPYAHSDESEPNGNGAGTHGEPHGNRTVRSAARRGSRPVEVGHAHGNCTSAGSRPSAAVCASLRDPAGAERAPASPCRPAGLSAAQTAPAVEGLERADHVFTTADAGMRRVTPSVSDASRSAMAEVLEVFGDDAAT